MTIGILVKLTRPDFARELTEILNWLNERGCQTLVAEDVAQELELSDTATAPRQRLPELSDILLVFGGDGTLLSAARLVGKFSAPILGVNLGTLGFLTETSLEDLIPSLERLLAGEYRISRRWKLAVELRRQEQSVASFEALNDAVINKGALARIISLDAYSGSDFIANFLADGLIVATPTGSTAYSLAAGGPILFPSESLIAITPICPHTLTNRPLILPATNQVRVLLRSGDEVMLTVDGQVGSAMREGDELICTRSEKPIELIQPGSTTFFDILRQKLKWGER